MIKINYKYIENTNDRFQVKTGSLSQAFVARPWQRSLIARTGVSHILKSRQVGCTTLASLMVLKRALNGVSGCIVTRSEGQIKQIVKIMRHATAPLALKYDSVNHVLSTPGEDIYFSNSNFESVRGLSAGSVYVTECGEIRDFDRVVESVVPLVTAYQEDFVIWFDGTVPLEMNSFVHPFTGKYSDLITRAKSDGFSSRDEYFCVYQKSPVRTAAEAREFEMELPEYSGVLTVEPGVSLGGLGDVFLVDSHAFLYDGKTVELLSDTGEYFSGTKIRPASRLNRNRHVKISGFTCENGITRAKPDSIESKLFGILGGY
jgi:hypothetical protein